MKGNDKTNPGDFWNHHSLEFLEMAMRRDYQETITVCDGYGKSVREGCGDTIEFFVMVKEGKLDTISYDLKGCLFSHACANAVIELAQGRSIEGAGCITSQDIVEFLKTLPENEFHCAEHALSAFKEALDQAASTV